jgi:hypothetical protein
MDRAALLEAFATFPARFAAAARAADGRPVPAGEWGPREVAAHLLAVETEVWHARFGQLAGGEQPRWAWTEPGLAPGFDGAAIDPVLAAHAAARATTVALVRTFDGPGWARSGTHVTFGVLDVAGLLRIAADHDSEHLASLASDGPG